MANSTRPTYTPEQIQRYLDYIGQHSSISLENTDSEARLAYLNEMIPLQLSKVPFENLDLHYSKKREVSLDPGVLFDKIVERADGRGGYCMQNNLFFGIVLRSLGYNVMPCGARVNSAAEGEHDPDKHRFFGWGHMVNMIVIGGRKYLSDVGFGNNGPTVAAPLIDGWVGRKHWNTYDDMLLKHTHIKDNSFSGPEQKLWVFHVRFGEDGEWQPMYCFSEVEFLPQDFAVMNHFTSTYPITFFTREVICRKYILDKEGKDIGDLTLYQNHVKERKYGNSQVIEVLKSERDRAAALKRYFDITLNDEELEGMKGWVSEIQ